jgi:hypothetical protein
LNKRAGKIAERVVNISLMPPTIRRTTPTTNKAIVLASDPFKKNPRVNYSALTTNGRRLTARLAEVEAYEQTNDSSN